MTSTYFNQLMSEAGLPYRARIGQVMDDETWGHFFEAATIIVERRIFEKMNDVWKNAKVPE